MSATMVVERKPTGASRIMTPIAPSPSTEQPLLRGTVDDLLDREWLITNATGGYAGGTVIGCPTRRYHGLLVWPRRAPLERFVMLAATLDVLKFDGREIPLTTFEFDRRLHPSGYTYLTAFEQSVHHPSPYVQWTYKGDNVVVQKRVTLHLGYPGSMIEYRVTVPKGVEATLEVSPMVAMRDFHSLRRRPQFDPWNQQQDQAGFFLQDRADAGVTLALLAADPKPDQLQVRHETDWWYNFQYRQENERGFWDTEDLFVCGKFILPVHGSASFTLAALAGGKSLALSKKILAQCTEKTRIPAISVPVNSLNRRMRAAGDQFIVRREKIGGRSKATILAGYHWFGDWGRDSFISLPGLLIDTQRYQEAAEVLTVFAGAQKKGLIPNRFDDYGGECEYNTVDGSLWFIHACDVYLNAYSDQNLWRKALGPACKSVVEHFCKGTDFEIKVDNDGFLRCGNADTQITWMDAKNNGIAFTPRHGKPVEVNALWYHGLRVLAERFSITDAAFAKRCEALADAMRDRFASVFWNDKDACLCDCVRPDEKDASIRPNQIFAVSLPHTPLSRERQQAVLDCVTRRLLTPYGLRSLSPDHPQYRGRYAGGPFERDSVYHQGTVWSWLMGPYVEAYLRVHDFSPAAKTHCRRLLDPLLEHFAGTAGLESISEIFDGDPPHRPRGCIAQAWSVAELYRALTLVSEPDF